MTRDEHLAECKQRALEYLDRGELANAVASMISDLSMHPETDFFVPQLTVLGGLYATNNDADGMRRWIEGFK